MENLFSFTTSKTIKMIVIYFLLFLAGDLLSSLPFDFIFSFIKLPYRELYVISRMLGALLLTIFFFWLYTTKYLHLKMKDFGITCNFRCWGILLSVLLPAFVIIVYLIIGEINVNAFSVGDILLIALTSISTALRAGVLEEMLFRGFIMRLLENRWNKYIAILAPSIVFSFVHIPSMQTLSISGIVLLIISGTLVGVMFSLVAFTGKSVSNSIILHSMWNFVMVTNVLHITTAQGAYGNPIFSIIIYSENPLLTGAGFGMEASVVSMIGYVLICVATGFVWKCKTKYTKS